MLTNLRRAACVLASLLVAAQLLPSIALACEGGGATLTPFESSEGKHGKCPKENIAGEPVFKNLKEWCEYEIHNGTNEELEVQEVGMLEANPGCKFEGTQLCVEIVTKAAQKPECQTLKNLLAGNSCFDRTEYTHEPAVEEEMKFLVKLKAKGGAVTRLEAKQKAR
jgi:hypothetical protein